MNVNKLENDASLVLKTIVGSRAYGIALPTSDYDFKGVFIMATRDRLAGRYTPQYEGKGPDRVYYEIERFLELLMKGNPNVLDMLNMPQDCIVRQSPFWSTYFPDPTPYLTKTLRNTFAGYATSQIKKARGLNKMIHHEEANLVRKDVLDFCYVLMDKEESMPLKRFRLDQRKQYLSNIVRPTFSKRFEFEDIGLAKVNNFPDTYSMYLLENEGGIVSEDSNDVQLRSIPKDAQFIRYLRFDKNAYSQHCKDYRRYQTWLKERSEERHATNKAHGKNYDGKNLAHCVRLLNMAEDIAAGRGLVVRRPEEERKLLIDIRMGVLEYDDLLEMAEKKIKKIDEMFLDSNLPDKVDQRAAQDLLMRIRLENL